MNKKALLAVAVCFMTGCATTHYFPMAVSPISVGPKEKVVGVSSGIGESLQDAIKNAIGTTGADTMINVFIDQEESCTEGWASLICVPTGHIRVFGTLIKYVDASPK